MTDKLQQNFEEVGKDLETRWIELSQEVRTLSSTLKEKSTASALSADVDQLAEKAELLCDHVERIHADVVDLLENLETRVPLPPERDFDTEKASKEEIERENIQIQREQHTQTNIKDVIKALFMYVDDPKERLARKK